MGTVAGSTLRDVQELSLEFTRYHLTPDRWDELAPLLRDLGSALEQGDDERASSLVADIRRFGPTRLAPIHKDPEPAAVLSRDDLVDHWNRLVGLPAEPAGPGTGATETP